MLSRTPERRAQGAVRPKKGRQESGGTGMTARPTRCGCGEPITQGSRGRPRVRCFSCHDEHERNRKNAHNRDRRRRRKAERLAAGIHTRPVQCKDCGAPIVQHERGGPRVRCWDCREIHIGVLRRSWAKKHAERLKAEVDGEQPAKPGIPDSVCEARHSVCPLLLA